MIVKIYKNNIIKYILKNIVTDEPGYINPNAGIHPPEMRFSESTQNEDYYNPNQKTSDPNLPGKELEMIRQEGKIIRKIFLN